MEISNNKLTYDVLIKKINNSHITNIFENTHDIIIYNPYINNERRTQILNGRMGPISIEKAKRLLINYKNIYLLNNLVNLIHNIHVSGFYVPLVELTTLKISEIIKLTLNDCRNLISYNERCECLYIIYPDNQIKDKSPCKYCNENKRCKWNFYVSIQKIKNFIQDVEYLFIWKIIFNIAIAFASLKVESKPHIISSYVLLNIVKFIPKISIDVKYVDKKCLTPDKYFYGHEKPRCIKTYPYYEFVEKNEPTIIKLFVDIRNKKNIQHHFFN